MEKATGLKFIAALEASKGLLAILGAVVIHDVSVPMLRQFVAEIVQRLHLNPANYISTEIVHLTDAVTSNDLHWIVIGALAYGIIRCIEAYGLWHSYRWTEWFALLSGAIYVPFELYHMLTDFSLIGLSILVINLGIIAYMWWVIDNKPHH